MSIYIVDEEGVVHYAARDSNPTEVATISGIGDSLGFNFTELAADPSASGVIESPTNYLYSTYLSQLVLEPAVKWSAQNQTISPTSTASVSWLTVTGTVPPDFDTPATSTAIITRQIKNLSGEFLNSPYVDSGDIFNTTISGVLSSGVANAITFNPQEVPGFYSISLQFPKNMVREATATVLASGTPGSVWDITISGGKPSGFKLTKSGQTWEIGRQALFEDTSARGRLSLDYESGNLNMFPGSNISVYDSAGQSAMVDLIGQDGSLDIVASGTNSEINISTLGNGSSLNLSAQNGDINISAVNGGVFLTAINEDIVINNNNGAFRIDIINSDFPVEIVNGNLTIDIVNDNLTIDIVNGRVDMRDVGKGLILPRLTNTEKNSVPSPVSGQIIFNTTSGTINVYDGSSWRTLAYA